MTRILAALVAASLLGSAAVAAAEPNDTPYQRIQVVSIDDGDEIVAGVRGPDGRMILPDPKVAFPSLIEYRYDFTLEMVATSEDF